MEGRLKNSIPSLVSKIIGFPKKVSQGYLLFVKSQNELRYDDYHFCDYGTDFVTENMINFH